MLSANAQPLGGAGEKALILNDDPSRPVENSSSTLTGGQPLRVQEKFHCCPKQDGVVMSAVESEGIGSR